MKYTECIKSLRYTPCMLVGNVHLVAGNAEALPLLRALLKKEGLKLEGNPDVYQRVYHDFGIEEARELRSRASLKAMGQHRIFIIVVTSITSEAQNALLKTLEEPPAGAMFFIIVPSPQTLLSTLRSRAQILELSGAGIPTSIDMQKFLAASPDARLKLLSPLLEKGDDDKRDLGAILSFLSALERHLARDREGLPSQAGLHALYRTRKYIGDKGALIKPLLEQIALLVPVI